MNGVTDNIIFLMTDQHSISTLGCYGNPVVRTPVLDGLAESGTRFTHAFTPTAICTPARASLLTGAAPFRHRLLANYERNVGYLEDLSDDQFTFAEALRAADWRLGLVGKWHGGVSRTAANYGFEGPTLPGWHNPVDHPDYLAYLDEHGLPPYRISDPVRGVAPNGGQGNLMAARLHQPVEATFEHYLATRTIARICPTSFRTSISISTTRMPSNCRRRCGRRSRASLPCNATTARTGPSTRWTRPPAGNLSPPTGVTSRSSIGRSGASSTRSNVSASPIAPPC
jgi:hypothetical protein